MEEKIKFKCKSCGAGLKKEEKYCSYCGSFNESFVDNEKEIAQPKTDVEKMLDEVFNGLPPFFRGSGFPFFNSDDEN